MQTNIRDYIEYDTPEEAISAAITNSGKGYKEIACGLWPSMRPDSAYARLKNALNPDKDEKLSFSEILYICKMCNRFDPIYFACDELSLYRPEPKAPEDEACELQRQFINAVNRLEYLQKRIDRNMERSSALLDIPDIRAKKRSRGAI